MAYDQNLADQLLRAIGTRPGISERRMFGGLCLMLNGNMLCGVEQNRYMFRVGKEREAEALAKPGASPMDFTGRPMSGFVYVEPCDAEELEAWVDFTAAHINTLPVKELKAPKPRKSAAKKTSGPKAAKARKT